MAMKRPPWPGPRCRGLNRLGGSSQTSRASFARFDAGLEPQSQRRLSTPAVARSQEPADISTWKASSELHAPLPRIPASVERLLHAVQSQHPARLVQTLENVGIAVRDTKHPDHASVYHAIEQLPSATVSEIFRCFDPLAAVDLDVAHGRHIAHSFALHSPSGGIVDDRGLRRVRTQVYQSLLPIFQIRRAADQGLTILEYEVMMRCAGVSFQRDDVRRIFGSSAEDHLQADRTVATWKTFLEARFLTDPAYYQFDKSRVVFLPRNLPSSKLRPAAFTQLEKLRMAQNALLTSPWNVDEQSGMDVRRLLRHKTGLKSSINDFYKAVFHGHIMDEEALCTAMVAFSRSGSSREIRYSILRAFYGIEADIPTNPDDPITITGGKPFASDDPRRPTSRLLLAITEAFGSCSDIIPAIRLVDYVSKTWNIPVPAKVWSNLLQWTYLNSSKPYRGMHRLARSRHASYMGPQAVRDVFELMTSEPHSVTPTVDDYHVMIKICTDARSLNTAADLVRTKLIPQHDRAVREHDEAILDEVLVNTTTSPHDDPMSAAPLRRREAAAFRKDYLHRIISSWCQQYLSRLSPSTGKTPTHSSHAATAVPDFVREFSDFLPVVVRYRTPSGSISIDRRRDGDAIARYDLVGTTRLTLPTKRGRHTPGGEEEQQRLGSVEEEWPVEGEVVVRQTQARARLRKGSISGGEPGSDGDTGEEYWKGIRRELLL